jgi:phage-related protein
LGFPHSRPMPSIGKLVNELRIPDKSVTWRLIYRIDTDAVIIVEVFAKKTQATPQRVIDVCRRRLLEYDLICGTEE